MFGFDTLVDFKAQFMFDGKPVTPQEWKQLVRAKEGIGEIRGEWMELIADELTQLEDYWLTAEETRTMSVSDLLKAEADPASSGIEVACDGELHRLLDGLCHADSLEILDQPEAFDGQPRECQNRDFSWLSYLKRIDLGACLADDMGLGKTVQILAAALNDKSKNPKPGPPC